MGDTDRPYSEGRAAVGALYERPEKMPGCFCALPKLSRLRQGSEAYLHLLPDLEVVLDVLRSKAEHAHEALEDR